MTPGTYVRLRREARRVTLFDLSLALETAPPVSARTRVEWLQQMEADIAPISMLTAVTLADLLCFDLVALCRLIAISEGAVDVVVPAICQRCGCSDQDACLGGCSWVEPDLCSNCASATEGVAA